MPLPPKKNWKTDLRSSNQEEAHTISSTPNRIEPIEESTPPGKTGRRRQGWEIWDQPTTDGRPTTDVRLRLRFRMIRQENIGALAK